MRIATSSSLVAGDLNSIRNPELERFGGTITGEAVKALPVMVGGEEMHQLFSHFCTEDAYRETIEPEGTKVTRGPWQTQIWGGTDMASHRLDKIYTACAKGVTMRYDHMNRAKFRRL